MSGNIKEDWFIEKHRMGVIAQMNVSGSVELVANLLEQRKHYAQAIITSRNEDEINALKTLLMSVEHRLRLILVLSYEIK